MRIILFIMSSHHIVRDNQEPALVLANLTGVAKHTIHALLEWSPTVVVYAEALEDVLPLGIKLDVLVASHPRVQELTMQVQHQAPVKFLSLQPGEDPVTLLLYFFRANKQNAVTWVGLHPEQVQALTDDLDVVTIYNNFRWVYVRSGTFIKWLPAGTVVKVWPQEVEQTVEADGRFSVTREHSFWLGEKIG